MPTGSFSPLATPRRATAADRRCRGSPAPFFYADARALLVSHWRFNSEATVRLATGTFAVLAQQPAIGRAEALRRAMVAEIARGGEAADPANWGPFILVGASR